MPVPPAGHRARCRRRAAGRAIISGSPPPPSDSVRPRRPPVRGQSGVGQQSGVCCDSRVPPLTARASEPENSSPRGPAFTLSVCRRVFFCEYIYDWFKPVCQWTEINVLSTSSAEISESRWHLTFANTAVGFSSHDKESPAKQCKASLVARVYDLPKYSAFSTAKNNDTDPPRLNCFIVSSHGRSYLNRRYHSCGVSRALALHSKTNKVKY